MPQTPGRTSPPRCVRGSSDGGELPKAWAALESPCWHRKQLSGESRSHLHFKVTQELGLTGLQILLGTGSKDPAQGNTYGKTSEELVLIHPFGKWDSQTLTSHPGGLRGAWPHSTGMLSVQWSPVEKPQSCWSSLTWDKIVNYGRNESGLNLAWKPKFNPKALI